MFEGISLCTIHYSELHTVDSLAGLHIEESLLTSDSYISEGMIYLKDCSYLFDGTSRVCPQFPISDFAKKNLFYLQSFSLWKSGASYYTKRKNLDSYLFVFTYSGSGKLDYRGKTYPLREGDGFLINCREPHFYRSDRSIWEHCDLHFDGNLVEPLYQSFSQDNEWVFHLNSTHDFQSRLEALLKAYVSIDPYREYKISALLNEFIVYLMAETQSYYRVQKNMPDQLKYLIHYVNSNYTSDLSLEFLADFFGFSKYHLCRIFKKYTGFTLNDYITQLRLERAKELLRTTALPANKICFMVGINDENYFYRIFKKHAGASPQKYRKG